VNLTTWPDYHEPKNFEKFTAETGVKVNITVFGSNEEMFAKLKAGGTGWDVLVPTNYTIETYVGEDMFEPLDGAMLPNYDPKSYTDPRFTEAGTVGGKLYAVHKDWGTTGFVINSTKVTEKPTSWKEFWDLTNGAHKGRTMVHDYQLTTIGNALKYFGYSFNSNDEKELAEAEKLLLDSKPNLFAINSDYKPSLINGDAYMSVCWTGDGKQLKKTDPAFEYILGKEGGEIWADFYAVPKGAPHRAAAVKWLTFLGSKQAQDTFNPVKGSIPARKDANAKLYGTYLKWALKQWKTDKLAGSLTHGVVASNAWNTAIDTALGLFLQNKDVAKFQTALAQAAAKNS
jgi:spermidine/putrescine transport system substrate-binding protein